MKTKIPVMMENIRMTRQNDKCPSKSILCPQIDIDRVVFVAGALSAISSTLFFIISAIAFFNSRPNASKLRRATSASQSLFQDDDKIAEMGRRLWELERKVAKST